MNVVKTLSKRRFEHQKLRFYAPLGGFCCHGAKSFIVIWCEVVYPHRFSVLRLRSPSARHLPARYRGLEDGSLRFLLFPSLPSLLSLISLIFAIYSSFFFSLLLLFSSSLLFFSSFLFFSHFFFVFLLFPIEGDTSTRERRDFNLPNF